MKARTWRSLAVIVAGLAALLWGVWPASHPTSRAETRSVSDPRASAVTPPPTAAATSTPESAAAIDPGPVSGVAPAGPGTAPGPASSVTAADPGSTVPVPGQPTANSGGADCPTLAAPARSLDTALSGPAGSPSDRSLAATQANLQDRADRTSDPVAQQRLQELVDSLSAYRASASLDASRQQDIADALVNQVRGILQRCG